MCTEWLLKGAYLWGIKKICRKNKTFDFSLGVNFPPTTYTLTLFFVFLAYYTIIVSPNPTEHTCNKEVSIITTKYSYVVG